MKAPRKIFDENFPQEKMDRNLFRFLAASEFMIFNCPLAVNPVYTVILHDGHLQCMNLYYFLVFLIIVHNK